MQKDYVSTLYIRVILSMVVMKFLVLVLVNCQTFRESRNGTPKYLLGSPCSYISWYFRMDLLHPGWTVALSLSLSVNDCFSFILGVTIIKEDSSLWTGSLNVCRITALPKLTRNASCPLHWENEQIPMCCYVLFESVLM